MQGKMFYKVDFSCNDGADLQKKLNYLYNYKDDLNTKVLHRKRLNLFYLLMEELLKKNSIELFDSALDIGCNSGAYSKIISDFGFKYVLGIDINKQMIEKATNCFAFSSAGKKLEYKIMDAERITGKYSFILCTEVIEHTDNPDKVISNIVNCLSPKGIAVISLPNKLSFPYIFLTLIYKITNKPMNNEMEQHLKYPFYKTIKIFTNRNLILIRTTGTNLVLISPIIYMLYKTPAFSIINKFDSKLSMLWPLKYFTQFFFIIIKNIE